MRERWKQIAGYEGLYEVSNLGRVRSVERLVGAKFAGGVSRRQGRILVPVLHSFGYLTVTLSKNDRKKRFTIHRLVATAFLPNPLNKPQVNHIDGVPGNAKVTNLEWVTRSENQLHAFRTGLQEKLYGEDAPRAKLTQKQAEVIRSLAGKHDAPTLAKRYGVGRSTITAIIRKERYLKSSEVKGE